MKVNGGGAQVVLALQKAGQHPDGRAFGGELYGERNVQHTYRIINHSDLFQR